MSGDGKRLGVFPSSSSAPAGAECGVAGVGSAVTGMLGSSEGGTVGGAVAGAALLGPAPPPPPFAAGTWTAALACLPSGWGSVGMLGRLGTGGEVEEVVGDRRRRGGSGEISSASCVEIEVSSEIETSSAASVRRSMSPAAIRGESAIVREGGLRGGGGTEARGGAVGAGE